MISFCWMDHSRCLVIYLNQGLTSVNQAPPVLKKGVSCRRWEDEEVLQRFLSLLTSDRTAVRAKNILAAMSSSAYSTALAYPQTDGKTLATLILSLVNAKRNLCKTFFVFHRRRNSFLRTGGA